jgi:hypothetical protein
MALQFFDETGVNALPAGIRVTVYQPQDPIQKPSDFITQLGVLIGSAFTTPGGNCAVDVQTAVSYIAVFDMSGQAPGEQISGIPPFVEFIGGGSDPTTIVIPGYRSPTLSTTGYANNMAALWPRGWFTDGLVSPGIAYGIAILKAAIFAQADAFGELIHGALRLQSSAGSQIDTWAYDFFGGNLPRYQGETDASYYARILIALQAPKTTLFDIQAMAQAFYNAITGGIGQGAMMGDVLDISGGLDVVGGLDITQGGSAIDTPQVYVWDRQSRPDLANLYNVNPNNNDGSFVIQVGIVNALVWFLDNSYLDNDTYLSDPNSFTLSGNPPDPRLGALVNFVKAGGTKPLYLVADLTS